MGSFEASHFRSLCILVLCCGCKYLYVGHAKVGSFRLQFFYLTYNLNIS